MISLQRKSTRLALGAGAVALVALGAWALSRHSTAPLPDKGALQAPATTGNQTLHFAPGAPQLAYLRIEAAVEGPVPLLEPLNGRLAYDENHTARVFAPVQGRVLKVLTEPGTLVKAGQPLVTLDIPDYADLRKAEADLAMKRSAYNRAKALFDGEVLARKDLEGAQNDLQAAAAEADRSRSRLRNVEALPGQAGFALRTPLAGVVTERQATPGSEVRPDSDNPLFVVSDPRHLWAYAELPEKDLAKVHPGQPMAVMVDAYPDQRFQAVVESVGDVLDAQSRRVPVRCAVPNPDRKLKPEMFARLMPVEEGRHLPRVPNAALVTTGLHTYIFVELQPGALQRREVQLAYRGHEASYVEKGLNPGERVVTAGALLLNAELGGN